MKILLVLALAACGGAPRPFDGMALYRSGHMHELRDRLRTERAPTPDAQARNAILLARTVIDLRVVWDESSFADALAALATARPSDPRLVAELEQATGEVLFWNHIVAGEGTWDEAGARFARALELRVAAGDTRGIAESTFYRGLIAQFTTTTEEAKTLFTRALEIAGGVDDPLLQSYPVRHLADLAESAGDLERADALHRKALALRERAGDAIRLFNSRLTLAGFLCERMRECEAARPQIEGARRIADELKMPHGKVAVAVLEGQLAEWHGDVAARDRAWDRAIELATSADDTGALALVRTVRATTRLRANDAVGAMAEARAVGSPEGQALLVQAALLANDVDTATAALAAAWTDAPAAPGARLYLAAAAWIAARGEQGRAALEAAKVHYDERACLDAALAAARRDHDVRAELDVLIAIGDRVTAQRLATSAHLPGE